MPHPPQASRSGTNRESSAASPTRAALAVLAVLAGLAGCSGSGGDAAPATPSSPPVTSAPAPSTTTTTTATASADPATRLAALARRAARASYTATYDLRGAGVTGLSTALVEIARPAARITLTSDGRLALYVLNADGQFGCGTAKGSSGRPPCYRIAGGQERLPRYLDPGVEHLFLGYPGALAEHPGDYTVTAAAPVPTGPGTPAGACFRVAPHAGADTTVAPGTYCYAESGALTAAVFGSGRLVLTDLGPAPDRADLVPPTSPTPLPTP